MPVMAILLCVRFCPFLPLLPQCCHFLAGVPSPQLVLAQCCPHCVRLQSPCHCQFRAAGHGPRCVFPQCCHFLARVSPLQSVLAQCHSHRVCLQSPATVNFVQLAISSPKDITHRSSTGGYDEKALPAMANPTRGHAVTQPPAVSPVLNQIFVIHFLVLISLAAGLKGRELRVGRGIGGTSVGCTLGWASGLGAALDFSFTRREQKITDDFRPSRN